MHNSILHLNGRLNVLIGRTKLPKPTYNVLAHLGRLWINVQLFGFSEISPVPFRNLPPPCTWTLAHCALRRVILAWREEDFHDFKHGH